MLARNFLTALVLTILLALALTPSAAAHASATSADGKVKITWGLLEEPGFTHEKNRLDLIIRDNATNAGIGGIAPENITELSLRFSGEEYPLGNVTANRGVKSGAFAGAGNYTSAKYVYLTKPGIYTLHIKGTIAGSAVDLDIPATHEYEPMTEIMFPEEIEIGGGEGVDLSSIEARLAALEAKTATQSTQPATVITQPTSPPARDAPALGVLVVAAALVAVALARRRA